VLSLDRSLATAGRGGALGRIARRSTLLFVVGIFYYGGITRAWPDIQVSGVLPRIAFCYFAAATLYVLLPRKGLVIAAAVCVIGYGALLAYVPFPDLNLAHGNIGKRGSQAAAESPAKLLANVTTTISGVYEEGRNLTHYVDFRWLPGRKRNLYYTNEGLLSTIPSVATTLFGVMAGWLLTSTALTGRQKVARLLGAGAAGIALGLLWSLQVPIIKRIWTPSFCLVAAGCSAWLLAIFYLLIDVWQWQRWCGPFLWVGTNALTVYLAENLIDFGAIAARLGGGNLTNFLDTHVARGTGGLVVSLLALALPVLLVRFLYERKIFLRL
jgi:predicted acyltransferase